MTHYVRRQYGIECVWDGDAAAYPDFMRRVRLAFERTPRKKKHLLGPEVVAQLTGRAWVITQDLSHRLLVKRNGVIYLLEYVRDRLGRTRLRRPTGQSMATWASQLRHHYTAHVIFSGVAQVPCRPEKISGLRLADLQGGMGGHIKFAPPLAVGLFNTMATDILQCSCLPCASPIARILRD